MPTSVAIRSPVSTLDDGTLPWVMTPANWEMPPQAIGCTKLTQSSLADIIIQIYAVLILGATQWTPVRSGLAFYISSVHSLRCCFVYIWLHNRYHCLERFWSRPWKLNKNLSIYAHSCGRRSLIISEIILTSCFREIRGTKIAWSRSHGWNFHDAAY